MADMHRQLKTIALHKKYPNKWQDARKEMAEKYYVNEPDLTKTIWNAKLKWRMWNIGHVIW